MSLPFTTTQKQRLAELDCADDLEQFVFADGAERESAFRRIEGELVRKAKARLNALRDVTRRPALHRLESTLVACLVEAGFVEVTTPTFLSRGMLSRMGIDEGHPLHRQVYWIDDKVCLRPMLAPHLYYLMRRMGRLWPHPIRLFEVGSCFRKETKGAKHLSEFTMLNLVEMGLGGDPQARLEELAALVMGVIGLPYRTETESSEIYGTTTDIIVDGIEVASGATGPHPLDANWQIADDWAGFGIGLERIVMLREDFQNIRRAGRSLIYVDGARINI